MKNKKKGKNMNTYNEIKEVESKITNLDSFIDKNNDLNLQGKKLAKVSDAIESVIFNQEKLKQLKLKLEKEKNLTYNPDIIDSPILIKNYYPHIVIHVYIQKIKSW